MNRNNKVILTKNEEEQIIYEAISQIKEKMVLHMLEDYNNNPLNEAIPLIAAGALIRGAARAIGTRIATRIGSAAGTAAGKIRQGVNAVRRIDVLDAIHNYNQNKQQQQQQNIIPPSYNTLMMQQLNQQNASNPQ